jgi:hypothetical protein
MNNRVQRYRKFGSVAKKFGGDLTRRCHPANELSSKHLFPHFKKDWCTQISLMTIKKRKGKLPLFYKNIEAD